VTRKRPNRDGRRVNLARGVAGGTGARIKTQQYRWAGLDSTTRASPDASVMSGQAPVRWGCSEPLALGTVLPPLKTQNADGHALLVSGHGRSLG
jgi:hypothetical protein